METERADTPDTTGVAGVPDTRGIPLDRLAHEGSEAAAESLRHVLPADSSGRVTVARFGSSI